MIEPDINERLARFAPSQNIGRIPMPIGDEGIAAPSIDTTAVPAVQIDPVAADIVRQKRINAEQPLSTPDMPETEVDPVAAEIVARKRETLNARVLGSRVVNPDEAAKAIELGRKIGVNPQVALADMQRAEQQAYLQDLRERDLVGTDPVFANFMAKKDFADIAHDDVDVLSAVRPLMLDIASIYYTGATPAMRRGYRIGELQVEMGRARDIAGLKAQWSPKARLASEISKDLQAMGQPEGILGMTAYVVGQQVAGLPELAETALMGATMGGAAGMVGGPLAPATVPAGIALGLGGGLRVGMMRTSFMTSAGLSYQNMLEKGYDQDVAYNAAIGIGIVNATLDAVSLEVAGPAIRKLGVNVFRSQTAKALAQPTVARAAAEFGRAYRNATLGEGGTEALQSFSEQIIDDFARVFSGKESAILDEGGIAKLLEQTFEEGLMGLMGASLIGAVAPGANFYYDMRRAAETTRQQEVIERISTISRDSKLARRSPDVFERFLEGEARGAGVETFYVDGLAARQIFAQSGLTVQQLEEAIPGIGKQLQEIAADQRTDIEIPTARFGARLANTPLGDSIKPHVRIDPNGMSFVEAQQFNAERAQRMQEAEQILAQKQESDGAFVAEARDIYNDVRRQAMEAGQDSDVADVAASLYQAFVVTQAAEQNMTPAQFQAAQGVRGIQGIMGEMAPAAAPMEQAARKTLADVEQAFAELNVEQRLTETDTAIRPGIIRVPENLRAQGRATNAMQQLIAYADQVGKRIDVSPTVEFGANKKRLVDWYKRLGFVENKGRNKDFAISATMYRVPQPAAPGVMEQAAVLEQAPVTPGFYSALEREVAAIDAKALTASGWNERFKGLISKGAIKADELEWSGLADYLKMQEGKVSKDAVLEFLRGNGVRVERVTLGNVEDATIAAARAGTDAAENALIDANLMTDDLAQQFAKYRQFIVFRGDSFGAEERAAASERIDTALGNAFGTDLDYYIEDAYEGPKSEVKYEGYTLPGGRNYREVLLTLPREIEGLGTIEQLPNGLYRVSYPRLTDETVGTRAEAERILQARRVLYGKDEERTFRSTHWDQPNVLVHLRMNDRVDADGKRVLFVEEVQSDWGQAGKKKGFLNPALREQRIAELERIKSEAEKAAEPYTSVGQDAPPNILETWNAAANELTRIQRETDLVPRAPFVETTDGWLNLGLKQVMLEAVRGNYDRVAFVNGQQSADRYDLSKQINRIEWSETYNYLSAFDKEGQEVISRPVTRDELPDVIGKEVANKLLASQVYNRTPYGPTVNRVYGIEGGDMKVGGEGMKSFYDKIVPIAMGKLLKKYGGGKVGMIALERIAKKKIASRADIREAGREYFRGDLDAAEFLEQTELTGLFTEEEIDTMLEDGIGGDPARRSQVRKAVMDDFIQRAEFRASEQQANEQPGFDVTPELVKKLESGLPLFQSAAAPGPRGGIDIRRMVIMLTKASDRTTLWHEFVHFFLHMYTEAAVSGRASERQLNDLDLLLKWFKIDGETPAERLAKWSAMTLDQKRKHHEALTYNAEIYAFEGKAPSAELIPVFERLRAFMLRVYKSIRDDLNAIYRREFGEDLPILTGEVRQVMDRMLATDEQIRRQAAINEMKPAFETQEQSKMNDAEWAAYKAMEQEAIEAAVTDMNKASLRQMQWLSNARSRIVRDMQRKHDRQRKEVSAEVAAAVRVEPVYRAMTYLRTGKFIDADGTEIAVEGPHRLDIKRVKEIYETVPTAESLAPVRATGMPVPTVVQPDLAKLGTGSYGMMGLDGLDPDLVAETFGYSSGDELIRALVAAKPMKEEVVARTDAEMLRRYGDMNTPEAVEAEVQKSLHNEARARMLAVQLRWRTKATQPVRVMLEAAKQVARDLIAGKRVRDVRPSDFVAAEARASRDIQRLQNLPDPVAIGMAAQTRAMNDRLTKGMDNATAMAEAIVEGAKAAQAAEERNAALKAQYGADPQQALIRASRAQLYQNQLAAEALRVQDEVAKDIKYLRRVLRDENVKRMGAPAADQIAGLLERYEVAPVSLKRLDERRALTEWLAQQAELGLVPDIAPEIVNEARRVNYREVKVSEFRDLVDAIRQIEHIGKRERKAAQEKLRAKFDALKDEAIQSMKDVAAKRGRKARKELGDEDRKWAQLIAGYDAMQQTIGSIVYVLDGGQRDGPLARMLLFTANDAGNQETTDRADATLALSKILDPIERKGQFGGRKLYFPQIDDSLSLEQRMVIALNYGNQSNIDRLLNGEKWTDEQVQPILESLTEEQLNAVQAIWNYVESFKPRVAAQERNLLGREPNWIEPRPFTVRSTDGKIVNMAGGYYPAKYNPRRSSMSREMDESVEADRQMREAITAATTTRSYTKNRLDKPPEGGVLSRQMGGLYAGVNEVIHDLAWRTWAMDANRLLRDKEFQTVINSIYGRETYAAIKNWVDATVRGERGNYDVIENIAIGVRRNVSVSAMALKFITAAIQVTGLIPATVRTGITPMVRSVAHFAANPRESSRIAREKSSFMRNRGRTRYRDLNEIANIVRGESRARRSYLANAYVLIGLQQGMVDMSVWWAAYSKAIKEGKAEEMAVSIADQTVIDTQGSGMLKDLSQAMRGGQKQSAYAKLFTSFYQFSNTQYALLSAQLRTAPSMGKAAADAFMILVVGAFIEEMLRTLLKPSPDDEEPEDLAKALIANQIDFVIGLPFGGGELRGIGDMIVGEQAMQYRGPSGLRMVGEVRTFAGQTLQGEFDRAWTRSAINMSGLIWGIPSAQINDTIDGINAAVEGEVEGAEAVLAPITGVRR